jgi:hopanoid biosynthesis associated RND transporter like protein HpnN
MSECRQPDHGESRLVRLMAAFTAWVARHPWPVLLACAATLALSIQQSYTRLTYRTQRDDLMSADKACQVRWRAFVAEFGADDDIVFIAEGGDRSKLTEAVEYLAGRLQEEPQFFDRVFHKVDLRPLANRALLFLTEEELRAIDARLDGLGPLLGPAAPVAWRALTVRALLQRGRAALAKQQRGEPLAPADRDVLARLAAVARSLAGSLRDPEKYESAWDTFTPASAGAGPRDALDAPHYFFSADGKLAFLTARPAKVDRQSFTPAAETVARARALLADAETQFPGLSFGLTGLPVLENDEMAGTDRDSMIASWLALAGVALLYLVVYRGMRYPLLTVGSLVVGTLWSLGLTAATVGHLNILSASFAVMLIGMGDYGVLWVARFDEERKAGRGVEEALRRTGALAGPSILTAAVTTSLAFFATTLADFRAVAELGFIAGSGVLLCALACFVLMPALLVLTAKRPKVGVAGTIGPRLDDRAWLPGALTHPRAVLGITAALTVAALVLACRLRYDHNLLHMQSPDLDSVRWELKLLDRVPGAGWHGLSVADTPEQAVALRKKYEQLPEVSRVDEIASLVPPGQERRLPAVAAVAERVRMLPGREAARSHPDPDPVALRVEIDAALATLEQLPDEARLRLSLRSLRDALDAAPLENRTAWVAAFEARLTTDLWDQLDRLRRVSTPMPITLDDLPEGLRERFVGKSGKWLVRAFARENVWEYNALARFVRKTRSVDPEATGKPFGTFEGLRSMKRGFQMAGVYALAAIVLVLFLDFRSARGVLLGLLPLVLGVVLSLGLLRAFGVALNPANLIALPLIVGVGVDNGVHILHDFFARRPGEPYRMSAATGRGVLVAALTTMLGFGTLMISRHQGMRGLGLTLTLGVGCCMVAALVVLPVVLRALDGRKSVKLAADEVRRAA